MKSIVDFTNKLKEYFASNEALTNEVATRATNGAHNLLKNEMITQTQFGLTFTVDLAKGTIAVSGAKSDASGHGLNLNNSCPLKKGTYIVTDGQSDSNIGIIVYNASTFETLADTRGGSNEFTLSADMNVLVKVYFTGAQNYTFSTTLYPMIRLASDPNTTYQPYAKTNREFTEKLNGNYVTSKFLNTTNTIVIADGVKTRSQLLNELAAKFLAAVQALPNGQQARLMKMDGNAIGTDLTPIRKIVYENSSTSVVEEFNKINYDGSNFRLYYVFLNGTSPRACYANYNGTNWALNDMITDVPTNGNVIRLYYDIYSRV